MTNATESCPPSMWSRRSLRVLIILVSLLGACQVVQKRPLPEEVVRPPVAVTAEEEYQRARRAYEEGRWEQALYLLKRFLREYPRTQWTDEALYLLGSSWYELGEYREAARYLEDLLERFPETPLRWDASLRWAEALLHMGKEEKALEVAKGLLSHKDEHPEDLGRLLLLLGRSCRPRHPLEALSYYYEVYSRGRPTDRRVAREEALALLEGLSPSQWREVMSRWEGTFLSVYAALKIAEAYLGEERYEEAEALLKGVEGRAQEEGFGGFFEMLWELLLKPKERELTVGLLLPLSGRLASTGEQVLKGALLAAGVFGDRHPRWRVRFLLRDTGSSPQGAVEGFRSLRGKVQAVLGPLSPGEARAVLQEFREGDPLLLILSPLEEARGMEGVLQLSLPLEQEVEDLFLLARDEGLSRFGLFYPRNPYGRHVVRAFQEETWKWGGELVGYFPYKEGEMDFGPSLKEIKEGEVMPDALVVAEGDYTLCLLASQMAYYELEGVKLLALRVLDPLKVLGLCREYLEGAVLSTPFYPESKREEVRDFSERFRRTYGTTPGLFEALGWDGLEVLLEAGGKAEGLESLHLYGVTGLRGYLQGEPVGETFKLLVSDGRFEELP